MGADRHDPNSPPRPWSLPSRLPVPIATPRLLLRPLVASDAHALFEAVSQDRAGLTPWASWAATGHRTVEHSAARIEDFAARIAASAELPLGIFLAESGALVGGIGLAAIDAKTHKAELGGWLRSEFRNQGIGSEAAGALVSAAFGPQPGGLGLRRIVVVCSVKNEPSKALVQRLGLRQEMRCKQDQYVEGIGWTDSLGFAVLADEWDFERGRRRR